MIQVYDILEHSHKRGWKIESLRAKKSDLMALCGKHQWMLVINAQGSKGVLVNAQEDILLKLTNHSWARGQKREFVRVTFLNQLNRVFGLKL